MEKSLLDGVAMVIIQATKTISIMEHSVKRIDFMNAKIDKLLSRFVTKDNK